MRIITLLLISLMSSAGLAAIQVYEFDNQEQEVLYQQLTKELRCPKCQNQNIADSNAPLAQDLRQKAYELVKEGKNREQVVDYMAARFGNFVTYDPPMTPATIFLWLGPLFFVLGGLAVLVFRTRKNAALAEKPVMDPAEQARLERILNGDKD
ncbi:cytochrome c-type biogenesis protein CcmH [Motilimonas sp. 1_MG-2023]|uniref:cytochrome c-type biogenesis protein n=1 Tax=Motilimonas sp. 1_MG-2023 TaxID=3062672 RepID=UPI0026E11AA3|nr:cytochrome c-type biogenesis protein [Motilimonas sp. 1_MG-2023]MDO6525013.1 cytochrome c-type biogenesis protein CcmH [Motilimonas sp. 1_MG-2023]